MDLPLQYHLLIRLPQRRVLLEDLIAQKRALLNAALLLPGGPVGSPAYVYKLKWVKTRELAVQRAEKELAEFNIRAHLCIDRYLAYFKSDDFYTEYYQLADPDVYDHVRALHARHTQLLRAIVHRYGCQRQLAHYNEQIAHLIGDERDAMEDLIVNETAFIAEADHTVAQERAAYLEAVNARRQLFVQSLQRMH